MRQRQIANILQSVIAEWEPIYRLDSQVADARARMGEEKWAELNAEWSK